MSTKLIKPVTRQLLREDHNGAVIVTLEPGDLISFRFKGRRTSYTVSLHNVQHLAMMQFLNVNYRERLAEYTRKRKAGYPHLRKPRPPLMGMFSQVYQQALKG